MSEMEHHVRAVARAKPQGLLAADMPYGSCATPAKSGRERPAFDGSRAEAVKAEGGRNILPQLEAIIAEGIPVLGHLGMLPQNAVVEGGYHVKGKQEGETALG